jgi:hypothetical protein
MEEISIRQLSQAVKWSHSTVLNRLCLPQFNKYIGGRMNRRTIKIKDLPKVTELLYKAMAS